MLQVEQACSSPCPTTVSCRGLACAACGWLNRSRISFLVWFPLGQVGCTVAEKQPARLAGLGAPDISAEQPSNTALAGALVISSLDSPRGLCAQAARASCILPKGNLYLFVSLDPLHQGIPDLTPRCPFQERTINLQNACLAAVFCRTTD